MRYSKKAELDGSTRLAILRLEWALNSLRGTAAPEDVTSAIRQIVLAKAELEQGIGWRVTTATGAFARK